jgi:hypothetical protein
MHIYICMLAYIHHTISWGAYHTITAYHCDVRLHKRACTIPSGLYRTIIFDTGVCKLIAHQATVSYRTMSHICTECAFFLTFTTSSNLQR